MLLWSGCGEFVQGERTPLGASTGDAKPAPLFDDQVWITTARDSLELVQRVVHASSPLRTLQREPAALDVLGSSAPEQSSDEIAILVPRAALPDISEAQHEEHHRCGGFMLQDSEAEALTTLHAERSLPYLAQSYTIDNQVTVEALLPEAQEPNVLATIQKLSAYRTRFHTSTTGEQAALDIRDTWQLVGKGRDDIEVVLVDHEKTPQPSIKMTIRGTSLPDELVVLGGHMDSISGRGSSTAVAPGADDNASGIAALTEIARVAVALDYRPARSVVFYGYAAEEIGLVGSAEIAARARADKLTVVGVMQLDMTNFTTASKPYIGIVTDFTDAALNTFSTKLIDRYLDIPYKLFECGYGCSDHASWTKNGFPASSPHEADMDEGNESIHTTSDTLALSKNSAAHTMHFVRFGLAFMAELAKGELEASAPVCSMSEPCASGQRCEAGVCVPAAPGSDDGAASNGFADACTTTADCASGLACEGGQCTAPSAPECSASTACPAGLTCAKGACVAPAGAVGARDAGQARRDAGVPDTGSKQPTLGTGRDPSTAEHEGDGEGESAEGDARAVRQDSGCALSASGGVQRGVSTLGLLAAVLLVSRRRKRALAQ